MSLQFENMYHNMQVSEQALNRVIDAANTAVKYKAKYLEVQQAVNTPWYLIAAIHYRESNFNFGTHLHNGDSLTKRTVHVPTGRPVQGHPPFTWVFSAIDALKMDNLTHLQGTTIGEQLAALERYNGIGYSKYHFMFTPYLWAGTQFYEAGKYTADGKFSATAIDKQVGCAPLIREMLTRS